MKITLKGPLPIQAPEIRRLLEFLATFPTIDPRIMPVDEVVGQIERMIAGQPVPAEWKPLLETLRQTIDVSQDQKPKSIETLLARMTNLCNDLVTARLKADRGWADLVQRDIDHLEKSDRRRWERLLSLVSAVSPEPPAKSWEISPDENRIRIMDDFEAYWQEHDRLFFARSAATKWKDAVSKQIAAVGGENFASHRMKWLKAVPDSKPGTLSQFSVNREILRGLLWTCDDSDDPELVHAIRIATEYLFRKNSPLGRTGVRILAHVRAPNSLDELTHLVNQVKAETQVRLVEAARVFVAERTGVPTAELDDRLLPDSGFGEIGRRVETLSGFRADLVVTPAGTVELRWFKPSGQQQKSVPAKVKREHGPEIRNLKTAVKEVKSTLATARQRLEFAPLEKRSWKITDWRERYFEHPVVATIARRILWKIDYRDQAVIAGFDGTSLVDVQGRPMKVSPKDRVSVWHALGSKIDDVLAWREWLLANEVRQPFKQAHREVYLVTDAERETEVYSNRFAAHILKQAQFRALAKTRGWKTNYLGPWDSGHHGIACREIPEWELRAEFWTNAAGDEYAHAGGFLYIATDQVRFYRAGSEEPLPLSEVPQIAFSEILRDVDLFVGVCSVGNDPTWNDGGPDGRFIDYWQNYSFGELAETAVTRRAALEQIIPRLSIADRCAFSERFLIVRGDLRSYRIHLGSSNILMEPNDEYLCIVPQNQPRDNLFLPFEGDNRLSVILSKALLLADDTKITDPTIMSQIRK